MKITVTEQSTANLNGFVEMVDNFAKDKHEEIFDLAFQVYGSFVGQTFHVEGPRWSHLADMTLDERADLGFPSGPILQRTGTLMRTLTELGMGTERYEVGPDSFNTGNKLTTESTPGHTTMKFGTLDPRFLQHQLGDGVTPPRPMVPEGGEQQTVLNQIDMALGALLDPPRPNGDWE